MSKPCKFPFLRNRGLVGSSYHVLCPPCGRQLDQEPLSSRIGLKDLARNPKETRFLTGFWGTKVEFVVEKPFFWCFLEDVFWIFFGKWQNARILQVILEINGSCRKKTLCIPFEWVLRSHMVGFKMPTRCLLVVSNREAIPSDL